MSTIDHPLLERDVLLDAEPSGLQKLRLDNDYNFGIDMSLGVVCRNITHEWAFCTIDEKLNHINTLYTEYALQQGFHAALPFQASLNNNQHPAVITLRDRDGISLTLSLAHLETFEAALETAIYACAHSFYKGNENKGLNKIALKHAENVLIAYTGDTKRQPSALFENVFCENREGHNAYGHIQPHNNVLDINRYKAGPDFLDSLTSTPFESIVGNLKAMALQKLFDTAQDFPKLAQRASQLAFGIEVQNRAYQVIEKNEDDHLRHLVTILRDNFGADEIREIWPRMSLDRKLDHLMMIARLQAQIFGAWGPNTILPFSASMADFVSLESNPKDSFCQAARAINDGRRSWIEINTHQDAKSLHDYNRAVSLLVHEQNHIQQFQLMDKFRRQHLSPSHAYYAFAQDLTISADNPWLNADGLKKTFYRASMLERHSFAVQDKVLSLLNGEKMRSETALFRAVMPKFYS